MSAAYLSASGNDIVWPWTTDNDALCPARLGQLTVRFLPPPELPENPVTFRHPPVTEVALSIQLDRPLVDLDVLAVLTPQLRAEFPQREQHPPLPPLLEDFGGPQAVPMFQFELTTQFSLPRSWFISSDSSKLLQLQADRFVFNWRKQADSDVYPRYSTLRALFSARLQELWDAIASSGKQLPAINFCEVTYVNQIDVGTAPGEPHPDLGDILNLARPWERRDFLPAPEDAQFRARFRVGSDDNPIGRLYVSAEPVFRPDGSPIYVATLVSRMAPQGDEMDAVWQSLDTGREWVVKGFKELTTEKMHRIWNNEGE